MDRKYYFVLSPYDYSIEVSDKAEKYYGTKDYAKVDEHPKFLDTIKQLINNPNAEFNVALMLIGVTAISMALSDSVYVSKNWEDDDVCKICHALAFSHGLDIVYES